MLFGTYPSVLNTKVSSLVKIEGFHYIALSVCNMMWSDTCLRMFLDNTACYVFSITICRDLGIFYLRSIGKNKFTIHLFQGGGGDKNKNKTKHNKIKE